MIKPVALALATVLLFGPLVAAEIGVRALIDAGRLPVAPSSNDYTDVSLANLYRLGKPDVLLIGASTVRSGMRPSALANLIHDATGRDVHVQSVAQGGFSLEGQRLLVRELARHDLLPRTVITGVSPLTLAGALASDGDGDESGDWFATSELGSLLRGCGDDPLDMKALECLLGRSSALWRWRGRPERLAEAVQSGMPHTWAFGSNLLREDGWLAGRPSRPAQLERNVDRALERVAEHIELPDVVIDDFAAFVAELRSHGVELIAVEMPYLAELEDDLIARNPDWDDERAAAYARLEEAADLDIIDVGGFGDWAEAGSFRDPRHLSRTGAGPFTRQLWAIPEFREAVLSGLASDG